MSARSRIALLTVFAFALPGCQSEEVATPQLSCGETRTLDDGRILTRPCDYIHPVAKVKVLQEGEQLEPDNGSITTEADMPALFDGSASIDPEGKGLTFVWDFGDGGTATGSNVEHSHAPGEYLVDLTVTAYGGRTDRARVGVRAT